MPQSKYPPQFIVSRGEAIYQQVRNQIDAGHKGKFFVVDIDTSNYEIDDDDLQATKRLLAKNPQAITYGLRIGYPAAYRLGGHLVADLS